MKTRAIIIVFFILFAGLSFSQQYHINDGGVQTTCSGDFFDSGVCAG